MTAFPETQRKAQEEIDALVGNARAPCLDDVEQLPYCKAIIQEIHRWRPGLPIAIFHSSTAEEKYNGYRIPNGATIFQNTCRISVILHIPVLDLLSFMMRGEFFTTLRFTTGPINSCLNDF